MPTPLLTVISWNILAPHLMLSFWSEYFEGQHPPATDAELAEICNAKITAMLSLTREMLTPLLNDNDDGEDRERIIMLCLQEVTDLEHLELSSSSSSSFPLLKQALIAHDKELYRVLKEEFGFELIQEEWKVLPNGGRPIGGGSGVQIVARTGVSTLVRKRGAGGEREIDPKKRTSTGKTPIASTLLTTSGHDILVMNTHFVMNFPRIDTALQVLEQEMAGQNLSSSSSSPSTLLLIGDLNAAEPAATEELKQFIAARNDTMKSLLSEEDEIIEEDRAIIMQNPSSKWSVLNCRFLREFQPKYLLQLRPHSSETRQRNQAFLNRCSDLTTSSTPGTCSKGDNRSFLASDHCPLLVQMEERRDTSRL